MRAIHWLPVAAFVAVAGAESRAHALAHLELEAGGGSSLRGAETPEFTGRVGLDILNVFTVSLRGQDALGPSLTGDGRFQAWSVFPELRLRTPTPFLQLDLALGAGLGHVSEFAFDSSGKNASDGASLFGQTGLGLRFNIPTTDWYLRAEGSLAFYSNVRGNDVSLRNDDGYGVLPVWQTQVMVGYTGIGFDIF